MWPLWRGSAISRPAFPFEIKGFHADEYINYRVVRLLRKLHVDTKSRRRSNDNALVESKNASVVRRHLGHAHSRHAALVNGFLRDVWRRI